MELFTAVTNEAITVTLECSQCAGTSAAICIMCRMKVDVHDTAPVPNIAPLRFQASLLSCAVAHGAQKQKLSWEENMKNAIMAVGRK
ncbi:hypothetical protein PR048_026625 [Dryococelus australis]|uniref:Uncharacterized protein n=1 Tax=Dryococelus australis TaxID=614101 RepID=A0ABQ9GLX2_9NEOP|nr:hypothetical protein PR048_026625 [Dryococelus australis]